MAPPSSTPLAHDSTATSTNAAALHPVSGATLDFKWAPAPKPGSSTSTAVEARSDAPPQGQPPSLAPPFAPHSRSFVPGSTTHTSGAKLDSPVSRCEGGEQGGGSLLASQRQTDSIDGPDGEDLDVVMATPASAHRAHPLSASSRPTGVRSPGRGPVDLSHLRLGRSAGSPLPPALHRSPPPSTSNVASLKPSTVARPPDSSSSKLADRPAANARPVPSSGLSSHQPQEPIQQRRSQTNEGESRRNLPGPSSQAAPGRASTAGSSSTTSSSTNRPPRGGGGLQALGEGMSEPRLRQLLAATKQNEGELRAICGAASNMLHNLKDKDAAIVEMWDLLATREGQLSRVSEEKEQLKRDLSDRARRALEKQVVQAANREATDTYDKARNVGESCFGPEGRHKLEQNQETKLSVLRQLEDQLADRDRVIKLLRTDLETRTGEVSEARDTIGILSTERQLAYVRIDGLASEVEQNRAAAERERKQLRDEIDRARLDAGEREQVQLKRAEEAAEKWSKLVLEAQTRLADEIKGRQTEVAQKLEESDQVWQGKIDQVHNDYKEKIRVLSTAHAEERVKLSLGVKVAREEADQASKLQSEAKQELCKANNRIQALVDSAKEDERDYQTKIREKDAAHVELQSRLALRVTEIDKCQEQISTLQARLSASESDKSESTRAVITRLESELSQAVSARGLAERQLSTAEEERDSLASNGNALESALSTAQSTIEALKAQISDLRQELAEATRFVSPVSPGSLTHLESASEELDRLRKIEDEFKEFKDGTEKAQGEAVEVAVKAATDRVKLELVERHAQAMAEAQDEQRKLANQVENQMRKLNKAQNELASAKGIPVLNPNSSSHGSSESIGGGGSGGGGSVADEGSVEGGKSIGFEHEVESLQDRGSVFATAQSSTLRGAGDQPRSGSSSSLSPVDGSPTSEDVLAPRSVGPLGARTRRKRTIDSTSDDLAASSVEPHPPALVVKRASGALAKRTASNENAGPPNRASLARDGPKAKVRIPPEPNKYTTTTKKKKKNK
ncbi:hypothetical protein JCM11491_000297 [Sporobolomyces phaffii]